MQGEAETGLQGPTPSARGLPSTGQSCDLWQAPGQSVKLTPAPWGSLSSTPRGARTGAGLGGYRESSAWVGTEFSHRLPGPRQPRPCPVLSPGPPLTGAWSAEATCPSQPQSPFPTCTGQNPMFSQDPPRVTGWSGSASCTVGTNTLTQTKEKEFNLDPLCPWLQFRQGDGISLTVALLCPWKASPGPKCSGLGR